MSFLSEEKLSSELIFKGRVFEVTRDIVRLENGEETFREVIHHSGGVCVVPVTENNEVIMVKQFRYPFNQALLEVVAGKINKGENHRDCGLRELEEETGFKANEVTYLGCLYPTVAYNTEVIHMYAAKGLTKTHQNLDEGEFLDVVKMPLEEAVKMVFCNEIKDAKSQIALLRTFFLGNEPV